MSRGYIFVNLELFLNAAFYDQLIASRAVKRLLSVHAVSSKALV